MLADAGAGHATPAKAPKTGRGVARPVGAKSVDLSFRLRSSANALHKPIQPNLTKIARQTNQSFASVLLVLSWIGLSHSHHPNLTNTRYHVNLAKPNQTQQNEDSSWYAPPRDPQFNDSIDS
jgi:hypothetical protein